MKRLVRPTPGKIAALLTLGIVAAVLLIGGGEMFSPGELSAENRRNVSCGGVSSHAELGGRCSACHAPPWSGQTMADRCLDCHTDVRREMETRAPLHGTLSNGMRCQNCHTEHRGAHASLTDLSRFDHNCAAFKLTGKHVNVNCNSCHSNNVYKGTPQACVSCHAEPKVPQVHKARYGSNCNQCHTTATWSHATFDHNQCAFKLTGKHVNVSCNACHKNEVFKGTPQSCVGCHSEPKVPVVHKANYGTKCAQCHTTSSFTGAIFKHDYFPINHGNRRMGNTCATCHQSAENFKLYTCYNCHEHRPAKIEQIHVRRNFKKFDNCVECHRHGRNRERGRDVLHEFEATACPHFELDNAAGCAPPLGRDSQCGKLSRGEVDQRLLDELLELAGRAADARKGQRRDQPRIIVESPIIRRPVSNFTASAELAATVFQSPSASEGDPTLAGARAPTQCALEGYTSSQREQEALLTLRACVSRSCAPIAYSGIFAGVSCPDHRQRGPP
jgi:hypothetical protein